MRYLSVAEIAGQWTVAERTVRNYCAHGQISGAFLVGKTWNIPEDAKRPERINKSIKRLGDLAEVLKTEKNAKVPGGIYHRLQIDLTYNTNHIEGSKLTQDQTRYIFETKTVGFQKDSLNVDDIIEAINHFRCIDIVIDSVNYPLSESFIKRLHGVLKNGTSDSDNEWFAVGDYKKRPNEVGGKETIAPGEVSTAVKNLLSTYHKKEIKTLEDIVDFHYHFEAIHPFQDGNGRVGRLIILKECLRNNIVPFIIDEELKMFYYRGLSEWKSEKGYLYGTCLNAQDKFKKVLDYFEIPYE